MLSGEGFFTQALLTIHYENVWSSYHHWVSHGSWRWRSLSHRLVLLVASKAPEDQIISMILDDVTLERCSENAPACRIHYQHSKKKNQSKYILGQCWVYVAIAFQRASDKVYTAISVMAFPSPKSGNTSKLKIASAMLKSIRQTLSDKAIRLLTDCWFMNWTLMKPALELGYEVVGHIPKNRVLYALPIVAFPPSPFKKRGKPRKYGVKMTPDEVEKLPETRMPVWLYGKYRDVSFRSCICRARFLKGRIVRVVWSRFINDKGETEAKLFLSTNPDMNGHEVLLAYSKRWPIEPMFQQLKHQFGCKHLWQKKLRTLLRWMHIKMAGYAL
ncbi:transposase, partial [Endozoicomonas sp.]|uniref:IS701 family transposase n=1 Tax=Endozoicomonas sp. TaxID=1892382 RepID=UPI00383A3BA4